jgi:hypothetical protein
MIYSLFGNVPASTGRAGTASIRLCVSAGRGLIGARLALQPSDGLAAAVQNINRGDDKHTGKYPAEHAALAG